jgi:hypothetical protein
MFPVCTVVDKFQWSDFEKVHLPLANSYFKQASMCSRPAAKIDNMNRLPQLGKVETNMPFKIKCSGNSVMELNYSLESKDLISNKDALW